MTPPTLSQLADIGAKAAHKQLGSPNYTIITVGRNGESAAYAEDAPAREAFVKAVLDAVGYKFPVDPEREAFDAWIAGLPGAVLEPFREQMFDAWKAGRAARLSKPAPTPETFEAHGYTWFKHTPGDPCPVDDSRWVQIITRGNHTEKGCASAFIWIGGGHEFDILGWRHA